MPKRDLFDDIIEALERRRLDGVLSAEMSKPNADAFFNPVPNGSREHQLSAPSVQTPQSSSSQKPVSVTPRVTPVQFAPAVPVTAGTTGTDLVDKADFAALAAMVHDCTKCPLHRTRMNTVFGEGHPDADLMFIGEGPGFHEDQTGRPFVGPAGQLLDKMIIAMQFSRETAFIANVVKCRPPGNRNPEDDEAATCLPYLNRQIDLIRPKVLVLLGAVPLLRLLGKTGITRLHGQWSEYRGIPTMATFHPSYLLRSPARKKEAWEDLQQVMKRLGKDPEATLKKMKGGAE